MQINSKNLVLLILRILLGIIFIAHGGQKIFGWFGGSGADGFINYLASLGVPEWLAYCAMGSEFFGGIMVLLGVATQLGALMIAGTMLGALYLVHWEHGFFLQNNGSEYVLCLLVIAAILALFGPGSYYLWEPYKAWKE